ncbi:MAG: hypothetical protein QM768_04620 [Agriterribacter sp.]
MSKLIVSVVRRFIICILMHLCIVTLVESQQKPPALNFPTSPEAALIGKFGDIPVSNYTGTTDISVPLYSINVGNANIPITLRYHNSGIKVEEQATWVGLGWDLSPAGTIIQEVRGKRDYVDNNLASTGSTAYTNFKQRLSNLGVLGQYKVLNQLGFAFYNWQCPTNCMNGICLVPYTFPPSAPSNSDDAGIIGNLQLGNGDPDIYHFQFGGVSGSFYINPETKQVVIINKTQEIFFEFNSETSIQATTIDGTRYVFGAIEAIYDYGYMNPYMSETSGRTYKLTSIYYINGTDVQFEYSNAVQLGYEFSESSVVHTVAFDAPVYEGVRHQQTKADVKILKKITTANAIIEFNLTDRQDVLTDGSTPLKKLSSIDIISRATTKKVKSFEFYYSYFPYNDIGKPASSIVTLTTPAYDALGKRLKLDSLKEVGYDESSLPVRTMPPFRFEYNTSVTMAARISFAKDMWGYYNGAPNANLLPDLRYFDYPYIYKSQTNNVLFAYNYPLANRYADNAKAGAYLLNKITYPTGGYTEFGYEPNTFINKFIPNQSSPVFKSYDAIDNSIVPASQNNVQFKLSKRVTVHFENAILNGKGNYNGVTPLTYAQMGGCYIRFQKFKFVNGSPQITIIKQWDLSTVLNADFIADGGKRWVEDISVAFDPDPNPYLNYQVVTYFPDNLNNSLFASTAGVSSHVTFYDDTGVDITESVQCGMRIREIRSFQQTGTLAQRKKYTYSDGKLLNDFVPLIAKQTWSFMCTNSRSNCPCPSFLETPSGYYEVSINSRFIKQAGNPIGYGKVDVKEMNESSSENNGTTSYEYENITNSTSALFEQPVVNLKNGFITKEKVFDNTGILLSEKSYTYSNLFSAINYYYGLKIITNFRGNIDPYESAGGTLETRSKYSYYATPILAEFNKLSSLTTKYYSTTGTATESETYTYNSEGSNKTTTKTNSKGETLISNYYYPLDLKINSYVDNYMINAHNTGSPVVAERYNGVKLTTKQRIVFGSVNDAPTLLPQFIYDQNGSNAEEKSITIDKYDDKGNILQYTSRNGIPVSIVWNTDKTLPTAKIENATYASLLALPSGLNSDFRSALPNAMVTTYTYAPLVGVSSITDPAGRTITYLYDSFGRLKAIKDKDGNVIKTMDYQYQKPYNQ